MNEFEAAVIGDEVPLEDLQVFRVLYNMFQVLWDVRLVRRNI